MKAVLSHHNVKQLIESCFCRIFIFSIMSYCPLMLIFTEKMGQIPIFSNNLLFNDQISVKEYTRYLV